MPSACKVILCAIGVENKRKTNIYSHFENFFIIFDFTNTLNIQIKGSNYKI